VCLPRGASRPSPPAPPDPVIRAAARRLTPRCDGARGSVSASAGTGPTPRNPREPHSQECARKELAFPAAFPAARPLPRPCHTPPPRDRSEAASTRRAHQDLAGTRSGNPAEAWRNRARSPPALLDPCPPPPPRRPGHPRHMFPPRSVPRWHMFSRFFPPAQGSRRRIVEHRRRSAPAADLLVRIRSDSCPGNGRPSEAQMFSERYGIVTRGTPPEHGRRHAAPAGTQKTPHPCGFSAGTAGGHGACPSRRPHGTDTRRRGTGNISTPTTPPQESSHQDNPLPKTGRMGVSRSPSQQSEGPPVVADPGSPVVPKYSFRQRHPGREAGPQSHGSPPPETAGLPKKGDCAGTPPAHTLCVKGDTQ
jgi:hypothetical protein